MTDYCDVLTLSIVEWKVVLLMPKLFECDSKFLLRPYYYYYMSFFMIGAMGRFHECLLDCTCISYQKISLLNILQAACFS